MLQMALWLALLVGSVSAAGQDQPAQATPQLPAPTDIDPQLTEQLRRQEQNLADAILRKDADALDRLVGPGTRCASATFLKAREACLAPSGWRTR